MAICTMFNWMFNFFVSYFFLDAVHALGRSGTFWMYAAFGIVAVVFFSLRVPETKNRSLEQIEREIHGGQAPPSNRRRGDERRGAAGTDPHPAP